MKLYPIIALCLILILSACQEDTADNDPIQNLSTEELTIDQQSFDQSWTQLQTDNPVSDPIDLNGLRNDSTMLNYRCGLWRWM